MAINLAFLFIVMVIESYLNSEVLYTLDGYLGVLGLMPGIATIKYLHEKTPGWTQEL